MLKCSAEIILTSKHPSLELIYISWYVMLETSTNIARHLCWLKKRFSQSIVQTGFHVRKTLNLLIMLASDKTKKKHLRLGKSHS